MTMEVIQLFECGECQQAVAFRSPLCSNCGATEWRERSVAARGQLYTFTTSYISGSDPADQPPYTFGYVELEGGTLVYARFNRQAEADQLKVGAAVRLEERPSPEGRAFFFSLEKEVARA